MFARSTPVVRRRSSRHLLMLFGATVVVPGLLLAALGARIVQQERRLADQQLRERLERAADLAVRDLEREIEGWQSAFELLMPGVPVDRLPAGMRAALADPGSAVVVRRGQAGPSALPEAQILFELYAPVPVPPFAPATPVWAEAERAELRDHDFPRALRLYERAAAGSGAAQTRTAALHRIARTLRKAAREDEALGVYRQLAGSRESVGVVAADLIARYEICALLAARGNRKLLLPAARDLYRDLVEGRWQLEKPRFTYYAEAARAFVKDEPSVREDLARLTAIAARKASLTDAAVRWLEQGTLPAPLSERYIAVQARARDDAALLLSTAWLSAHVWPGVFRSTVDSGVDVILTGPGGRPLFSTAATDAAATREPRPHAARLLETLQMPWHLVASPRDAAAVTADLHHRQRVYVAMLGLMLALLGSGSYFTLRAVRRELEMAKLQADFVSAVSHEFRSPLTGIRQLGELLARGRVASDERRQEYYGRIVSESDRLARLVENVLDFSRTDEGRREYRLERLNTSAWLRSLVEDARAMRGPAAPHIVGTIPDALPSVEADREALGCAVHNLIDNAVKYSPGRHTVWVEAGAAAGRVVIRVRDQGVGIGERDRQHVFEKFYRAQSEITRDVKGAGLGLSLVARIVQAHGGSVHCESVPGSGSTFTIHLTAAGATSAG